MLQQDYVDLALLHGPSEPFGYQGGCNAEVNRLNNAQWRAYETFLRQGKTRAIGVSNYCPSCIEVEPRTSTRRVTLPHRHATSPGSHRDRGAGCESNPVARRHGARPRRRKPPYVQSETLMRDAVAGLMSYCEQHGIVVQAYSPHAAGQVVSNCSVCDASGGPSYGN